LWLHSPFAFFDIRLICSTFAAVPMDDAVGTFFL